ncbi:MAG: hypothetical protein RLZZ453_1313 [Chlamydiota bacterium]|jgi:hypothetical protein
MSKAIWGLSALTLLACGCDDNASFSSVSEMVQPAQRPVVSIVPIIDNTKNDCCWNLSDELSSTIYATLSERDHIWINHSSQVRAKAKPLLEKHNPFGTDLSWIKKGFQDEEFVAFLELVEHEEVLNQNKIKPEDPRSCSAELRLSMRVRVFDLRGKEPKIVLQELVHNAHYVHPQFNHLNFYQVSWKEPGFNDSPIGLAHAKFTKELSDRLEDYILTAART